MIRALAVAALLLLAPGAGGVAGAQEPAASARPTAAPPAARTTQRRRAARPAPRPAKQPEPVVVPSPAPRPDAAADLAPMPNRSIEAPAIRGEADRPSFSPTLIEPRDLSAGGLNRDRDGRLSREDRLFREPAPGATLRLPFSY